MVFSLRGEVKSTLRLPATLNIEYTGSGLAMSNGDAVVELPLGETMAIVYRQVPMLGNGETNGNPQVDVLDIPSAISLMVREKRSGRADMTLSDMGQAPIMARAIDLGLPSGTLWSSMNLGAEKEEDMPYNYGLYAL